MGGQLSVSQVMLSVPDWVKRSEEYNKAKIRRNRYFQQFEHFSPAPDPHIFWAAAHLRPKACLIRPGLTLLCSISGAAVATNYQAAFSSNPTAMVKRVAVPFGQRTHWPGYSIKAAAAELNFATEAHFCRALLSTLAPPIRPLLREPVGNAAPSGRVRGLS